MHPLSAGFLENGCSFGKRLLWVRRALPPVIDVFFPAVLIVLLIFPDLCAYGLCVGCDNSDTLLLPGHRYFSDMMPSSFC